MSEIDFEVRVSARRKKTALARLEAGRLVVVLPASLPVDQRFETARALAEKFWLRQSSSLDERAHTLASEFFPEIRQEFRARWVDNQTTRWASCTASSGRIRVSARLRNVPQWVLDAVLVHELAHLLEPSHSKRFRELNARYPRTADATFFLEGFSFGLAFEK